MDINYLLTIDDLSKELGVSRQRTHQLIDTYGVNVIHTKAQLLILRSEAEKIPKDRPPGGRRGKPRTRKGKPL